MSCFYQITKTLSFFGSLGQNFWTSDVLIRTSQSRKLLAQRDKFEKSYCRGLHWQLNGLQKGLFSISIEMFCLLEFSSTVQLTLSMLLLNLVLLMI